MKFAKIDIQFPAGLAVPPAQPLYQMIWKWGQQKDLHE